MIEFVNIASRLRVRAARHPDKLAVVKQRCGRAGRARYDSISFGDLDQSSDWYANALERRGIVRAMRTVVMVKPGIEFFTVTFALFKLGSVVVLLDPGMGRMNLGRCIADAEPEAFVGIPLAHAARKLFGWGKRTVRTSVVVSRSGVLDAKRDVHSCELADTVAEETAAILFTSGSTGMPKGAVYTHGVFEAQVQCLHDHFGLGQGEDEVDLATFPLFALFDAGLGVTAVIPDMNASKPGRADPRRLVAAMRDQRVTQMFGSPALVDNLGRHCEREQIKLPLRHVMTAGAPVRTDILERFASVAPQATMVTPYGATEALPVAVIESRELLNETRLATAQGAGICVGQPVPGLDVRIIGISDEPIVEWSDDFLSPPGEVGEIVVRGPLVTREYYNRPEQTALAKMRHADGGCWHRMGDVGYFDEQGRLWYCGRKSQRVVTEKETLFTEQVEAIFNGIIFRTALVGVGVHGVQLPVVCCDNGVRHHGRQGITLCLRPWVETAMRLKSAAEATELTRGIEVFLVYGDFPVDVRHNAKINREALAIWAAKRVGARSVRNRC